MDEAGSTHTYMKLLAYGPLFEHPYYHPSASQAMKARPDEIDYQPTHLPPATYHSLPLGPLPSPDQG